MMNNRKWGPKPRRSFFKGLRDRINPVRGQAKIFSNKLGKNNSRSEHLKDCERLETPSDGQTSAMEGAKSDSNEGTGKEGSDRRNSLHDSERSSEGSTVCKGSVHLNHFRQAKEGTKQVSNNYKSKKTECPLTLHTLTKWKG